MGKAVEFEIKVKDGGSSAIRALTVEASNADEAIGRIVESASNANKKIRDMADWSILLDTSVRALQNFGSVVQNLATPFNSFEKSMRAANTMAGKSGDAYEAMKDQIVAMSKSIPLAREELANGLYQVISNGVPEDNWLDFLEQSAKASVGGLADLSEVVKVTSTMIKNYQGDWSSAEAVQDKIQMTAKNGVTSFEELANALPRVSGRAASLGVTMDELLAVFAATTGSLGKSDEVATKLGAVLTALTKPSSEATAAAAAMGISFDAASIKACGGFQNFLTELDATVQAYAAKTGQLSETIYGQLFGSAEALGLLGALNGASKDKFVESVEVMKSSAGSIAGAYDEMRATGEAQAQTVKNQAQSMLDLAGAAASTVAPYTEVLGNMGMMLLAAGQLKNGVAALVTWFGRTKVATLALAAAQRVAAVASTAWGGVQTWLNAVLTANPIGVVVMAIAGLVAIVVAAYNNCETFRKICDQVWAVIKKVATAIIDQWVKSFKQTVAIMKEAWAYIQKLFGITDEAAASTAATENQAAATEQLAEAAGEAAGATEEAAEANEAMARTGLAAKKANDWKTMSYDALSTAIEAQKKQVQQLTETESAEAKKKIADLKAMEARQKQLGNRLGLTEGDMFDGKQLMQQATSLKALENNLQYYQTQLEKTSSTDGQAIKTLTEKIRVVREAKDALQAMVDSYSRPAKTDTLERLDAEISYQKGLLQRASAEERAAIEATIETLNKLKQSWDDAAAELKKPGEVGTLSTMRDLNDAISWYEQAMQRGSAQELAELAKQRAAYEAKLEAMKRATTVVGQQQSLDDLGGMSDKQLKMELKLIGLDQVKNNIRTLQKMLDDTKNPLDENMRQTVEAQVKAWERYEKQLKKGEVNFKGVYGETKKVGSGVSGITTALKGDGNAWDKLTGVVDGAMSVMEGVSGVVKMVRTLTAATQQETAAQTKNTTAQTLGAVAKGLQGSASTDAATKEGANAGAMAAEANAATQDATANVLLAGSKVMAAHASIPFVGIAIAGGLIAAMTAVMFALPKFANGGIAYGPTLGLFGEYAGAANNPEVVAPLNRLRDLLGLDQEGGSMSGRVEFRIKGRRLAGVLERERLVRSRR